ncbi:MAG: CBS domain-containing protein [Geobacteraceae bacterium]|nr:CBS domain-containing protein [Geobacteraceae bacterium]
MTRVTHWMKKPITVEDDSSIMEASHIMKEERIPYLPVMHSGKLVGLLTESSISKSTPGKATSLDTWELHYLLSKIPVKEAMIRNPYTVRPEADIRETARFLHDRQLSCLCVVSEEGELVGILTVTDVLEALLALCKDG